MFRLYVSRLRVSFVAFGGVAGPTTGDQVLWGIPGAAVSPMLDVVNRGRLAGAVCRDAETAPIAIPFQD